MSTVLPAIIAFVVLVSLAVWLSLPTREERELERAWDRMARENMDALVARYEAGEIAAQDWAQLCVAIPGLRAAYEKRGTHTNN